MNSTKTPTFPRSMFRAQCAALALTVGLILVSVPSQAIVCINCGTEWTQVLNEIQLVKNTINSATSVANQITGLENQVKQYKTMLQNLEKAPSGDILQRMNAYSAQLSQLQQLLGAANAIYTAGTNAQQMLTARLNQMRSLNLDATSYWQAEATLAQQRGGLYQTQYNNDLATLQDAQNRVTQLNNLSGQINSINGQVTGLQTLAQYSHAMAQALNGIQAVMTRSAMAQTADHQAQDLATQQSTTRNAQAVQQLNADIQNRTNFSNGFSLSLPEVNK